MNACFIDSLSNFLFDILGLYWIDPNGGITNDAIKVYCEFHTNASCLYPGEESQVSSHGGRGGVVFTQLMSMILSLQLLLLLILVLLLLTMSFYHCVVFFVYAFFSDFLVMFVCSFLRNEKRE